MKKLADEALLPFFCQNTLVDKLLVGIEYFLVFFSYEKT
jgi:hypothetical protein